MRRNTIIAGLVMLLVGIGIGYTIALGQLFIDTRDTMREIACNAAAKNSDVKMRILAKQFSWHFHYPGADGKFGVTAINLMSKDNVMGLDMSDPASEDDFVSEELVLPCQTTASLIITSVDVIHAVGHLEGDFEQDAIPGIEKTKALVTPSDPRKGRLQCVQLCGEGHPKHHAPYRFVKRTDYADWTSMKRRRATP